MMQKKAGAERRFLQTVIDQIADPILVIDRSYRVLLMNKTASAGKTEDVSPDGPKFCYQISHSSQSPCESADHPCPLREVISMGRPSMVVHHHKGQDGADMIVEINASPLFGKSGEITGIIEVCRDITEKVKLQELKSVLDKRIARQQKEASISTLAGGIAHDFNNILTSVMGYTELLLMKLEDKYPEKTYAENIFRSSQHMADLTRQMLAYARGGMYRPAMFSINDAICQAMNVAQAGKPAHVETHLILKKNVWNVFADRDQIQQVMVNLFRNAFEAMEKTGGRLTVHTFNEAGMAAIECGSFNHEHPAGDYVHIVVSDTGAGISSDILPRIFEPFFSTKFTGRGLGLAAVAGIIGNHRGCITVESEVGRGSSFHIYLPRGTAVQKVIEDGEAQS